MGFNKKAIVSIFPSEKENYKKKLYNTKGACRTMCLFDKSFNALYRISFFRKRVSLSLIVVRAFNKAKSAMKE